MYWEKRTNEELQEEKKNAWLLISNRNNMWFATQTYENMICFDPMFFCVRRNKISPLVYRLSYIIRFPLMIWFRSPHRVGELRRYWKRYRLLSLTQRYLSLSTPYAIYTVSLLPSFLFFLFSSHLFCFLLWIPKRHRFRKFLRFSVFGHAKPTTSVLFTWSHTFFCAEHPEN